MDSNDYMKLLGKKGIFKRGTDENWMVRLGSLTAVQNVKGVVLYYDEQNNGFDSFSVLSVNSKEVSDSKEVKENPAVSTQHPLLDSNRRVVLNENSTQLSLDKSNRSKRNKISTNTGLEKYIGQWGIGWNDPVKKGKDYGYRLIRLDEIKEKDGVVSFIMRRREATCFYKKKYDYFRPITKKELDNIRIGFGWNNKDTKFEKKLVRYCSVSERTVKGEKVRKYNCANFTGAAAYCMFDCFATVNEVKVAFEAKGHKLAIEE